MQGLTDEEASKENPHGAEWSVVRICLDEVYESVLIDGEDP